MPSFSEDGGWRLFSEFSEDGSIVFWEAPSEHAEMDSSPCNSPVPPESASPSPREPFISCPPGLSSFMSVNGLCHLRIPKDRPKLIAVSMFEKGQPRTMNGHCVVKGLPLVVRNEDNEDGSEFGSPGRSLSPPVRITLAEHLCNIADMQGDGDTTDVTLSPTYRGETDINGSRRSETSGRRSLSPSRALAPAPIDVMAHAPTLFNCSRMASNGKAAIPRVREESSLVRRINYLASKISSSRRIGESAYCLAHDIMQLTHNTPLLTSKVIYSKTADLGELLADEGQAV